MVLWYLAGTVFAIWNVFQSNGLDTRLLALGGILPVLVDAPLGSQGFGHSLLAPVAALTIVMVATMGKGQKLRRRRWIGLPIGWMCGTALSGAFVHQRVFWWPAFGMSFGSAPIFPSLGVALILELLGLGATWWCIDRFGLADLARRRALLREGRVSIRST